MQQHCLGVVIGIVSGGDPPGPRLLAHLLQECIAEFPGCFFDALPLFLRLASHITPTGSKVQAEFPGKRTYKMFVSVGFPAPQLVVKMRHHKVEPQTRTVAGKQVQKNNRIHPSAHRRDHPVA
jgi:hypothetical protein